MRILVVDDSRAMRVLVIRALRQAGASGVINEAGDGPEALAAVAGQDLILSGWNMPGLTGVELLRRLRASGNRTPFVFVTAESTAEMRRTATAAGAQGLIAKPFDTNVIAELLRSGLVLPENVPTRDRQPTEVLPVPLDRDVQDILSRLLGLSVTVAPSEPLTAVTASAAVAYVTDLGQPAVVALADAGFVNGVGAALLRVPAEVAHRATRAGQVDPRLAENTAEVLNVLSRLLNSDRSPHLRVGELGLLPGPVAEVVQGVERRSAARYGYEVTIPCYGRGQFTLTYNRPGAY